MDYHKDYIEELQKISRIMGARHSFASYTHEDIAQECVVFGLKAYVGWKQDMPPGPYIRKHLLNKIRNLHRDVVSRNEPPCNVCYEGRVNECKDSDGRNGCLRHQAWVTRNTSKSSLAHSAAPDGHEHLLRNDPEQGKNELSEIIDTHLKQEMRADYLKLVEGVLEDGKDKDKIIKELRLIILRYAPAIYTENMEYVNSEE